MFSVGIDMGGTFTDGYVTDGIRATVCKVPTTHFDLSRSVIGCLQRGADWFEVDFGKFLGDIDVLRVATTIGTNAVVEGTGDAVGVIVARGADRTLYGPTDPAAAIETFVAADHVRGVDPGGDPDDVLRQCRDLVALGVRRVVVSFPNGQHDHEVALHQVVRARYPEHYLRSIPLSLASEVASVDDDEVRTNTAVVNAYVSRPMAKLLYRTEGLLQRDGLRVPLVAVHSDASCGRVARTTAIATYSSGPAGGLALVARLAAEYGDRVVLGFDMGGTTLDLGLVRDGVVPVDETPYIRGVRVALRVPGIVSIGLGGSSIARQEKGEAVVGPESAGAVPGPACFGRGGTEPTLTDADLVLGFLGAGERFGDEIELVEAPARTALERVFDEPAEIAAARVRAAAHRKAADAIAALLSEAGIDPSDVVLYAFGGAGALHAAGVADELGIRRIRSFAFGSVFSARGVAGADIRQVVDARLVAGDDAISTLARLVQRATLDLEAELIDPATARFSAIIEVTDARHGLPASTTDELFAGAEALGADALRDCTRIVVTSVIDASDTPPVEVAGIDRSTRRSVWWADGPNQTPIVGPRALDAGDAIAGPALVDLAGVLHGIAPGWDCHMDDARNLRWERSE